MTNAPNDVATNNGSLSICVRIKSTREQLRAKWASENPEQATVPHANPYTQANVAIRVPVTTKTLQLWESQHEPSPGRLRQLARALDLPDDYFISEPEQNQVGAAQVMAELVALRDSQVAMARAIEALTDEITKLAKATRRR